MSTRGWWRPAIFGRANITFGRFETTFGRFGITFGRVETTFGRVAASALVAALAAGCDRGAAGSEPAAPVNGARDFQRQCAVCHGARGRGDGPSAGLNQAADLSAAAFQDGSSDEDIRSVIVNGRGLMPPWGHMGEARIDALVAFIRTLREDAPP